MKGIVQSFNNSDNDKIHCMYPDKWVSFVALYIAPYRALVEPF